MQNEAAFTLIELMVTVAIAVVIAALAVPAYQGLVGGQRARSQANELVTAMSVARSEALQRPNDVELCASTNGSSCSNNSGDWVQSWVVQEVGTGDVIRSWDVSDGVNINTNAARITFNRNGEVTGPSATPTFDVFSPGCKGDETRVVDINSSGQVSVTLDNSQC
jgi:type IV fimbrial biogenesis protein FimT